MEKSVSIQQLTTETPHLDGLVCSVQHEGESLTLQLSLVPSRIQFKLWEPHWCCHCSKHWALSSLYDSNNDGHRGPTLGLEFGESHLPLWTRCSWRPAHVCRDLGCVIEHLVLAAGALCLAIIPLSVNDTASCTASVWQECLMDLKIFALCQLYINYPPLACGASEIRVKVVVVQQNPSWTAIAI